MIHEKLLHKERRLAEKHFDLEMKITKINKILAQLMVKKLLNQSFLLLA